MDRSPPGAAEHRPDRRLRLRLILFALAAFGAARAEAQPVLGRWLTQDRDGVVEIYPCERALCGRIVGMSPARRPNGSIPVDVDGHPECGLTILRETAETAPGRWEGRITDPEDGSAWRCTLRLDATGRLELRGYVVVPLLGRTQVWTRYSGRLAPDCSMD